MAQENLLSDIDQILTRATVVPDDRNYWLVRTQGGQFYDSFREHNFIAINYDEVRYSQIADIKRASKDRTEVIKGIKSLSEATYKNRDVRHGLIASQLHRFIYEIKKGDVVVIPSYNSGGVSFGYITSTPLLDVSEYQAALTNCPYLKRKPVEWIRDQPRVSLDPYLYRALQAHQAINDISHYGEIVERSLSNFYIKNGTGNVILNVETNEKIHARDLFNLGYFLLNYSQNFFDQHGLPLDIADVEVKLNVNSKGKIHLRSPNYRLIWLIAVLVLCVNGGGLKIDIPKVGVLDISTDGIIKNIIEYQNRAQEREIKEQLMQSMDSLKIKSPEDAIKMLKQFSENKDLPK